MIDADLLELVRQSSHEIDQQRALTDEVLDALHQRLLFRWLLPRPLGGRQPHLLEWLRGIEMLAHADGSTGWCLNQGAVFATVAAWMDADAAAELWRNPRTVICHGPPTEAHAERTSAGDYRLSGQWKFGSGSRHATLFAGQARVTGEDHAMRLFISQRAELIDTWDVAGMRGTGSFDFRVADEMIPAPHSVQWATDRPTDDYPLYRIGNMLSFACSFGAVALGIARRALDEVLPVVEGRHPQFGGGSAATDHQVQALLGQAQARWQGARALLHSTVEEIWEQLEHDPHCSLDQRARLRMAGTHAMRESRAIADAVFSAAGGDAIRASHPVNRPCMDLIVAAQHMQARPANYSLLGRYLLGDTDKLAPMI